MWEWRERSRGDEATGTYEWRPEGEEQKMAHVRGEGEAHPPPPPLVPVVFLIAFYFIYLFTLNFVRTGTVFLLSRVTLDAIWRDS